jgi:hypothetical protein
MTKPSSRFTLPTLLVYARFASHHERLYKFRAAAAGLIESLI